MNWSPVQSPEAVLPAELVESIVTRSDGVPLFAEELAKGVVETGHTDAFDIPETLQDSLMARLDRLGEAKLVAQLGAAIGREFEYPLLEAVAPLSESALRDGLGRLMEAELVYPRGLLPRATYTFKHTLVQDTAYQSLLDSQRVDLHGRRSPTTVRRRGAQRRRLATISARASARARRRRTKRPSAISGERSSCSGRSPRLESEISRSWRSRWRWRRP